MFLVYPLSLHILLLDGVKAFVEGMKNLLAELKEIYATRYAKFPHCSMEP